MDELPAPTLADFVAAWDLYRDPVIAGVIAGGALGYVGVFIVLRRLVFVTAAVSQGAGLGVALAYFLAIHAGITIPPALGGAFFAWLVGLAFVVRSERAGVARENLLGAAYVITWAGAVLVGDRITQEAHDISAILFGTGVLVAPEDLVLLEITAAVVLAAYLLWHRGIVFAAFDPEGARVQGLPVHVLDAVAWLLAASLISVATRALGVLPVFALAVLPGMASLALARRMRWAIAGAVIGGAASGALGYVAAFLWSFPVGASQAATAAALLGAALAVRAARRRMDRAPASPP